VSERLEPNDPPPLGPPSPTVEAAVRCADDKSQSKHVSEKSPVDFPATEDSPNELFAAPVTMVRAVSTFVRLSLPNQMLGEGLIQ
jgi:hypothetical protein